MFQCKACLDKEQHISSLKAQIAFLQQLVSPKADDKPDYISIEANKILDGSAMPVVEINLGKEKTDEATRVEREFNDLVTGNYS